jgi:hypothetical protein
VRGLRARSACCRQALAAATLPTHFSPSSPPPPPPSRAQLMTRRDDHSGCTGVTALVTATHVILANCGDSRACILGTTALGGTGHLVTQRTKDHKPSDPAEAARIEAAGGAVIIGRVNGDLAVSRALGDFGFKTHPTLPPEKQMVRGWRLGGGGGAAVDGRLAPRRPQVSCEPDITVEPRVPGKTDVSCPQRCECKPSQRSARPPQSAVPGAGVRRRVGCDRAGAAGDDD